MIYYSKIIRIPIVIMIFVVTSWLVSAVYKREEAGKNGYPDGKKYKYIDIIPAFALIAAISLSVYLSVAEAPRTVFYKFISGFPALEDRIPYDYRTDPEPDESFLPEDEYADFVPVYSHIDGFVINEDGTVISSEGGSITVNIPEGWEPMGFEEDAAEKSFILLSDDYCSFVAELVTAEEIDLSTESSVETYAAAFAVNARKEKDIYSAKYIDKPFYADGYKFCAVKAVFREDKENNTYFFFAFPDKNQVMTLIIDVSADTAISTLWDMFMN